MLTSRSSGFRVTPGSCFVYVKTSLRWKRVEICFCKVKLETGRSFRSFSGFFFSSDLLTSNQSLHLPLSSWFKFYVLEFSIKMENISLNKICCRGGLFMEQHRCRTEAQGQKSKRSTGWSALRWKNDPETVKPTEYFSFHGDEDDN